MNLSVPSVSCRATFQWPAPLLCSPGSLVDTTEPSAGSPLLPLPARSDSPWLAGWLAAPFFSENQEAACPTYAQPRIGSGRALGEETAGVGRAQKGGRRRAITGVRAWCDRPAAVSVARPGGGRGAEGQVWSEDPAPPAPPPLLWASPCVGGSS